MANQVSVLRKYGANLAASVMGAIVATTVSILASYFLFGLENFGLVLVESIIWAIPIGALVMPLICYGLEWLHGDQYGRWIVSISLIFPIFLVDAIVIGMQFGAAEDLKINVAEVFGGQTLLFAVLVDLVTVMPSCFVGALTLVWTRQRLLG